MHHICTRFELKAHRSTNMAIEPPRYDIHMPIDLRTELNEPIVLSRQLITAVKALSRTELTTDEQELAFGVDPGSDLIVIKVLDRETKKVLRQIPAEVALKMARDLRSARKKEVAQAEAIPPSTL